MLKLKCKKHPRYKAIYPKKMPTCHPCWVLWRVKALLSENPQRLIVVEEL